MGHVQNFVLNPQYFHGSFIYNLLARRSTIEPLLKQSDILYTNKGNVDDELVDILLDPSTDPNAQDVFLSIYSGPAGPTRDSLLEAISQKNEPLPIYMLWGDSDGFVPLDDTVLGYAKQYSSFLTLDIIENAGHCLHDEYPHIVNTKVLKFLSSIREGE